MAEPGNGNNGESRVSYTVKEILAAQDEAAAKRHAEALNAIGRVDRAVSSLTSRVATLEQERKKRQDIRRGLDKAWVVTVGTLGLLVNIPAMLYFFR